MGKWLQRTIIITIVETWTLTWAAQDGRVDDARGTQNGIESVQDTRTRHADMTQTVIVSSSSITTVLPTSTAND
jgi:hypothetical protein